MIRLNPDISSILEANARPRPMNVVAMGSHEDQREQETLEARHLHAQEYSREHYYDRLEDAGCQAAGGASQDDSNSAHGRRTIISFRNPNSRSQRTDRPAKVAEKSRVMPIMPGVRKLT